MARIVVSLSPILVLVALALAGCGSTPAAGPASDAEFQQLITLYSSLVKNGAPPASEAAFKDAIRTRLKPVADAIKVADVDALFVSTRDGKPVKLVYGPPPAGMKSDVIAYEQDGVEGKRLVGFSLGMVEEVDEQRFRELVAAPTTR